jgi:hypothetical protein
MIKSNSGNPFFFNGPDHADPTHKLLRRLTRGAAAHMLVAYSSLPYLADMWGPAVSGPIPPQIPHRSLAPRTSHASRILLIEQPATLIVHRPSPPARPPGRARLWRPAWPLPARARACRLPSPHLWLAGVAGMSFSHPDSCKKKTATARPT